MFLIPVFLCSSSSSCIFESVLCFLPEDSPDMVAPVEEGWVAFLSSLNEREERENVYIYVCVCERERERERENVEELLVLCHAKHR